MWGEMVRLERVLLSYVLPYVLSYVLSYVLLPYVLSYVLSYALSYVLSYARCSRVGVWHCTPYLAQRTRGSWRLAYPHRRTNPCRAVTLWGEVE